MNSKPSQNRPGRIFIGIGGWTFEPWRGVFYPKGLPHTKETRLCERAADLDRSPMARSTARRHRPTFRKWASEVPPGFVFALKGPRFAVNRRVLKEAGDSIQRFLASGITELGDRLGPLLWQFAPTKKFDPVDFGGFLELLPKEFDRRPLRHSSKCGTTVSAPASSFQLLRKFAMPAVFTDHVKYPNIADITGDFVYARLQRGKDTVPTAYPSREIDAWTDRLGLGPGQSAG